MNKKILIDCERMKYPNSGIANVCKSIIKGTNELHTNFEINYYGPEKNLQAINQKYKIVPWNFWQKLFPKNISQYQLIHITHQLSDYFHYTKPNQKKIVTLHDLNFLHDQSSVKKKEKSIKLVQKNIGNADAIVCISEFAKNDFINNIDLFKLKKNLYIHVIYNGLIFPEDKIYQSEKYSFFKEKKYILTIGVLFPKKNQMVLLDFLEKTDSELVLITSSAKSKYKERFLEKINNLKLQKRVHILENISENDKNFLLQNCQSYIHPSLAEGFGIPPIEAMYFGKPVFLSSLTSLPEIGGNFAHYFKDFSPENMLKTYEIGMKEFYSKEEESFINLKNWALKFNYLEMAKHYLSLYKKLLE